MQPRAAIWQAFSGRRSLHILRWQHFVAEGWAASCCHVAIIGASELQDLHAGAGYLRAHTPTTPSKHADTTLFLQGCSPWVIWQTGLHIGAGAPFLHIASYRCGIRWIEYHEGNAPSRAAPLWLQG